jgi:hypothetical protein
VFDEFDSDASGAIDAAEVQALLLGLQLGGGGGSGALAPDKETIDHWFSVRQPPGCRLGLRTAWRRLWPPGAPPAATNPLCPHASARGA